MCLFFVFNTSCNVTLSCCFTSQYLLNTLVSLYKYVRNSCVLFSSASVLRLQQACNAHLSCRFTLQKCYTRVLNASVFNTSCNVSVTCRLRRKNRHNASVLCLQHALKCACFTSFYVGNSPEIRTFRSANACLLRFEHTS